RHRRGDPHRVEFRRHAQDDRSDPRIERRLHLHEPRRLRFEVRPSQRRAWLRESAGDIRSGARRFAADDARRRSPLHHRRSRLRSDRRLDRSHARVRADARRRSGDHGAEAARHAHDVRRPRRHDLRLPRAPPRRHAGNERSRRAGSEEMRLIAVALLATTTALAQQAPVPVAHIADDAKVIDRVAQASKNDLPRDLLRRIVDEDIELLRGRRSDGTYVYASYERMESSRVSEAYSINPSSDDRLTKVDVRGEFAYRLTVGLPLRRMVVTKNRPLWIENVVIEYIQIGR